MNYKPKFISETTVLYSKPVHWGCVVYKLGLERNRGKFANPNLGELFGMLVRWEGERICFRRLIHYPFIDIQGRVNSTARRKLTYGFSYTGGPWLARFRLARSSI